MTWDPPSDAELGSGKPGKASLARRIRDLTPSLAARESGAPWLNGQGAEVLITGFPGLFAPFDLQHQWTVPEGVHRIHVIAVGGGACGNSPTGIALAGSGGGAGGGCRRVLDVQPGQVIPITIGAGGNPNSVHPSVDQSLDDFFIGDGGRTTFGVPPFHLIAMGGKRRRPVDDAPVVLSDLMGGSGGAGDDYVVTVNGVNSFVRCWPGGDGQPVWSFFTSSTISRSGAGGDSYFGAGARPVNFEVDLFPGGRNGNAAAQPGAGGSGALGFPGIGLVGGRGANGAVLIRY